MTQIASTVNTPSVVNPANRAIYAPYERGAASGHNHFGCAGLHCGAQYAGSVLDSTDGQCCHVSPSQFSHALLTYGQCMENVEYIDGYGNITIEPCGFSRDCEEPCCDGWWGHIVDVAMTKDHDEAEGFVRADLKAHGTEIIEDDRWARSKTKNLGLRVLRCGMTGT